MTRIGNSDILRALLSHGMYLFPDFFTPVDEKVDIPLDIFYSFGISKGIDFDRHVFNAESTNGEAYAGLEKILPVPPH
jgi:hypothetical protein